MALIAFQPALGMAASFAAAGFAASAASLDAFVSQAFVPDQAHAMPVVAEAMASAFSVPLIQVRSVAMFFSNAREAAERLRTSAVAGKGAHDPEKSALRDSMSVAAAKGASHACADAGNLVAASAARDPASGPGRCDREEKSGDVEQNGVRGQSLPSPDASRLKQSPPETFGRTAGQRSVLPRLFASSAATPPAPGPSRRAVRGEGFRAPAQPVSARPAESKNTRETAAAPDAMMTHERIATESSVRGANLAFGMAADALSDAAGRRPREGRLPRRAGRGISHSEGAAAHPAVLDGLLFAGGPSIHRPAPHLPVRERIVTRVSAEWNLIRVDASVGDVRVREYYVEHDGSFVFAGFEPVLHEPAPMPLEAQVALSMPPWIQPPDLPGTFALGQPGGEGAYKYPSDEAQAPSFEERLLAHVMEQLAAGPVSLETGAVFASVNELLAQDGAFDSIENGEWQQLLHRSLGFTVREQHVFDASGARSAAAVKEAAASLLGISPDAFDVWENHFGAESISEQIFAAEDGGEHGRSRMSALEELSARLREQIALSASVARLSAAPVASIGWAAELALQWRLAAVAVMPGRADRMRNLVALLGSMRRKNVHLAARALALVFSTSELNRRGEAEDALFQRFSKAAMQKLMTKLMSGDAWDIVCHRTFRAHLTPEGNAAVNEMIEHANYDSAVERIRRVDVSEPGAFERLEKLLAESGRLGVVYNEIIRHMVTRVGALPPEMLEDDSDQS